jgi:hypothetical protein
LERKETREYQYERNHEHVKENFEGNACNIKNKKGTLIGKVPSTANGLYKVEQSLRGDY